MRSTNTITNPEVKKLLKKITKNNENIKRKEFIKHNLESIINRLKNKEIGPNDNIILEIIRITKKYKKMEW